MNLIDQLSPYTIALGIGLLIGAERQRRNDRRPAPVSAGVRTFAAASALGAVATQVAGPAGAVTAMAAAGLMAATAYIKTKNDYDPGITTEIALVLTAGLGALTLSHPAQSAMLGIVLAALLALRTPLHDFLKTRISDAEFADFLVIAGAALVIAPVLPNASLGPFNAINPRAVWRIVILVLGINLVGRLLVRWFGARTATPIAGFLSGFVSSSATIGAFAASARKSPKSAGEAAAAAVLSSVATYIQLAIILASSVPTLFWSLVPVLVASGLTALLSGGGLLLLRGGSPAQPSAGVSRFNILTALAFAAVFGAMLIGVAGLKAALGAEGLMVGAGLGGAVDVHAAALSVGALTAAGKLAPAEAVFPFLAACTGSAVAKTALSASGGRPFFLRVAPAMILIALAGWLAGSLCR
jgi:uncharacterized membrane protein (DUF4010 family)